MVPLCVEQYVTGSNLVLRLERLFFFFFFVLLEIFKCMGVDTDYNVGELDDLSA